MPNKKKKQDSLMDKDDMEIVCDLDLNKYLGKWFEIAKFSARGQKGLNNVTALYTLKKSGKIAVYNSGYKKNKKIGIRGSAWLRNKNCSGALYVRFFWPSKAEYNVIKLAPDYRYALVMGDSKSKLWILSRTAKMNKKDYYEILKFLDENNFNTEKLMKTIQNKQV
ncbi:MAG TPA: lipocalin family protein [Clostridia bacterium]|nr:lipocalin family protein [Clostridia bacterium]